MTASLPDGQTLSFQRVSKQNPRRFPAGGSCQVVRPNLEVALSAQEHADRVLVLQLIRGSRLGSGSNPRARNGARILLVEMAPVHVSSDRKVIDRSPDQVGTDDCEVEVRVATRQTIRWGQAGHEVGADQGLARIAILQLSIGTVDAAGPVGIPVMGVTTAEAPGLNGIDSGTNAEDAIGKTGETGALIHAAATAKHEEALREQALEVVACRAIRVDGLQVDAVARSRRDVLDRHSGLRCPAPLVTGVTSGFRGAIVSSMEVMRDSRELEQTPGLVDAHLTDDVRRTRAAPIVVAVIPLHKRGASSSSRSECGVPEVRLAICRRRQILQRERTGELGLTGNCNPDFNIAVIGGNIVWTPVKNLAFTADVNWTHLDQKYDGTVNVTPAATFAKPAALYELKDQNSVTMLLRAQRNF